MIIHLDSNYRNRALYPNPCSYALEINGTPPENKTTYDSRSCFLTKNNILFSFQFFNESPIFEYQSFNSNNSVIIDFNLDPYWVKIIEIYSANAQNFLVGYEVVDVNTKFSSVIGSSFKNNNQYVCILNNPITNTNLGTLKIINPSLSELKNNLLINGYSQFNQTPGQGFFQNEGVDLNTSIFNLTNCSESKVNSVEKPYRNVSFDDKKLCISEFDYIIILNNQSEKNFLTNTALTLVNIYPIGLLKFSIKNINFKTSDVQIGDLFFSDFGVLINEPIIPIIYSDRDDKFYFNFNIDYYVNSPSSKIILSVDDIIEDEIFFKIESPGNQINSNTLYILRKENDDSKTITIFSESTSYCLRSLENALFLLNKNFMAYFIVEFLAIPFYAVITNIIESNKISENLIYIENPGFFTSEKNYFINPVKFLNIYNKIGCLNYFSFYPNLPVTLSNPPLACYNITISSITLPNFPICGTNFLLADFPYVFVTFGNLTNNDTNIRGGTYTIGNLISNNPNALTATFLCAIANIRSPDIIKYVVVRSNQVVTVKLNLAENLRFSVFLPDGNLIRYSDRYELNNLNLPNNQIISSSLNCVNDNSLTNPAFNNTNTFTKVFPFDEYINISASFDITSIE